MEIVFTFRGTHGAIAGEKALLDGGVKVRVMPLPSSLGAGCGLCLRVDEVEHFRAAALLADAGIEPQGVYRKAVRHGVVEYVDASS